MPSAVEAAHLSAVNMISPTHWSALHYCVCDNTQSSSTTTAKSRAGRRQAHIRKEHSAFNAILNELKQEKPRPGASTCDASHGDAEHYKAIRAMLAEVHCILNSAFTTPHGGYSHNLALSKSAESFYNAAFAIFECSQTDEWYRAVLFARAANAFYPPNSESAFWARWLATTMTIQGDWHIERLDSSLAELEYCRAVFAGIGAESGSMACFWSSAIACRYAGHYQRALDFVETAIAMTNHPSTFLVRCYMERSKLHGFHSYDQISSCKRNGSPSQDERLAIVSRAFEYCTEDIRIATKIADTLGAHRLRGWAMWESACFGASQKT